MVLRSRCVARLCSGPQLRNRNFSSSSPWCRRGTLAAFPPTSSPELDAIITKFRETVFLPNHLNTAYRDMIYRPSQHYYLTGEEPIKVDIALRPAVHGQLMPEPASPTPSKRQDAASEKKDPSKVPRAKAPHIHPMKKAKPARETFTLQPLRIDTDIPNTRVNYLQMLKLITTPADFAIVPEFLHELRIANLPVTPAMLAKTARRAAELDRVDVIMQLFQSINTISIRINHPEIVREVMSGIVRHAINGYWTEKRLDQALGYADTILIMLQDERHLVESVERSASHLPQVWGTAVALEAVRQLRYGPRAPAPHRTHSLTTLAESFLERFSPAGLPAADTKWSVQNQWLGDWAPTVVGVRLTIRVLGDSDPVAKKLAAALSAMEQSVKTAAAVVSEATEAGRSRRGLEMLQDMESALEVTAPERAAQEGAVFVTSDGDVVEKEVTEESEKEKSV